MATIQAENHKTHDQMRWALICRPFASYTKHNLQGTDHQSNHKMLQNPQSTVHKPVVILKGN